MQYWTIRETHLPRDFRDRFAPAGRTRAADCWFWTLVFMTFRQRNKVCGFVSRDTAPSAACGRRCAHKHDMIFFFWEYLFIFFFPNGASRVVDVVRTWIQKPSVVLPAVSARNWRVTNTAVYCSFRCLFCFPSRRARVPGGLVVSLRLHFIILSFSVRLGREHMVYVYVWCIVCIRIQEKFVRRLPECRES